MDLNWRFSIFDFCYKGLEFLLDRSMLISSSILHSYNTCLTCGIATPRPKAGLSETSYRLLFPAGTSDQLLHTWLHTAWNWWTSMISSHLAEGDWSTRSKLRYRPLVKACDEINTWVVAYFSGGLQLFLDWSLPKDSDRRISTTL
jgi:hypothetical protein